jgi:hypothetical protein
MENLKTMTTKEFLESIKKNEITIIIEQEMASQRYFQLDEDVLDDVLEALSRTYPDIDDDLELMKKYNFLPVKKEDCKPYKSVFGKFNPELDVFYEHAYYHVKYTLDYDYLYEVYKNKYTSWSFVGNIMDTDLDDDEVTWIENAYHFKNNIEGFMTDESLEFFKNSKDCLLKRGFFNGPGMKKFETSWLSVTTGDTDIQEYNNLSINFGT